MTEETTSELNGAGTPDEWAAYLATAAPGPETAAVLPVLDAEKLSRAGRIDALKALERHTGWIQAHQAQILAALEAEAEAEPPAAVRERDAEAAWNFTCEEVACALKLSGTTAARRLEVARELDRHYPTTLGLLERGEICYMQAVAVTEACAVLDPEVAGQVEAVLVEKMPGLATGQTRRALSREILRADPHGAEQRHQARKRERQMVHYPKDDGMALWGATLPAEQAAAMNAAVDAHAGTLPDEGRTLEQKRVDALVDLVLNRTDPGAATSGVRPSGGPASGGPASGGPTPSGSAPDRLDPDRSGPGGPITSGPITRGTTAGGRSAAVVQVTVPLDVLIGDSDDPAQLKGYGPITAGQARRIAFAKGTVWHRLIIEPKTGMLIKTDPTTYKPTAETERHVIARDAYCTFPACRMPARRCDLDHVEPFNHHDPAAGGQTVPENLGALCRRHHRMKTHHPGWAVKRDSRTGTTTWTAPTGHRYTNRPHDYRH
ncbi:HNH endonuclease signature motif containing protein [Streptomyces malaysiensis]|uniref:HNH endonuclease n=1 Tax=Streptomyces malaysiensis subsp. samsunensis TaxID=459658 RepID=A0A9X2M6K1_STRMQ|nr:HNH endonuclease signature motif containing protein [Streptomyces samsunensis]MCQ8836003.1 HNH endonuclease [Streptomyces samsunensis]